MNWIWIVLIVIVGSAIINPILYFIYWELYERKEWIDEQKFWKTDRRFWSGEYDRQHRKQIASIRPQVIDVWKSIDNYWLGWTPICSSILVCFFVSAIIAKPFEKFWKWIIGKIAVVKV